MARVRSGQARPGPRFLAGVSAEVSRIKRDFACTFTGHFPSVLVVLRLQSRLMLEGWARTLSGPSPDLRPATTISRVPVLAGHAVAGRSESADHLDMVDKLPGRGSPDANIAA